MAQGLDADRILVVDDDYDIVNVVGRSLRKWGYEVDTFTNPVFALEQFKAVPNRYSLALLDIRMPEMNGTTLAALMLKIKPDLKIAIMTAYELTPDDFEYTLPTIKQQDIVKKPFKLQQICDAVKKQLQTA